MLSLIAAADGPPIARLIVEDPGACKVEGAMRSRLPKARVEVGGQPAGDDLRVRVARGEQGWMLEVRQADGVLALQRALGQDGGCEEVSRSAALIVARLVEDLRWPGLPAEIEAGALATARPAATPPPAAAPPADPDPAPADATDRPAAPIPLPLHAVLSAGGAIGFLDHGGGVVIDARAELPLGLRAGARTRIHVGHSSSIDDEGDHFGKLSWAVSVTSLVAGWCGLEPVRACLLATLGGANEAVEVSSEEGKLFGETPRSRLSLSGGLLAEAEYEPVQRLVVRGGLAAHGIADGSRWSVEGIDSPIRSGAEFELVAAITVGARVF